MIDAVQNDLTKVGAKQVDQNDSKARPAKEKTSETIVPVQLGENGEGKITYIGDNLSVSEKEHLVAVLRNNVDVFAFSMNDMSGIPAYYSCHKIDILPGFKLVKQKARRLKLELTDGVNAERERLRAAEIIRPIEYSNCLSNMVVVPKKNGKLRVYIDFTYLNKACPKDYYLMPRVDDLVMRTAGFEMLSFMDGYAGYNQIPMKKEDEEKTSFIVEEGVFCYKRMSFGLKNAGATYQKLVHTMFRDKLKKSMEVYIDDMLVKSLKK